MDEIDILYRDLMMCFNPLRIFLQGWQKIETIRDRRYKKEKFKVHHDNLALFRRKYGVVHIAGSDCELEN